MMAVSMDRTHVFEQHRARLFAIAYRMLGSVEDAEDLVQETYLRWHEADVASVRSPEAWLVAVVSRLSIDRLRRAATEREAYVGNWLPEPVTSGEFEGADRATELASDLSMAFLVLLERLAPEERAAFLLRDVFDCEYDEIARVLDKSEDATRQIVSRARSRVQRDRPRFPLPEDAKERLLERFLHALHADDQEGVLALLAPDVTLTADGGGKVFASRNVLYGRAKIGRMLLVIQRKFGGSYEHRVAMVNGEPTVLTIHGGHIVSTTSIATDGERITALFRVLNPDKLRRVKIA